MKPIKVRSSAMTRLLSPIKPPCAGCKLLRRRCSRECIFVPYFPSYEPNKFESVHRIFGASNVSKMLHKIPMNQREDAVNSLVYEANARLKDPVYGCVVSISSLQDQVSQLQLELAMALAETITLRAKLSEARSALACAKNNALETMDDYSLYSALGQFLSGNSIVP